MSTDNPPPVLTEEERKREEECEQLLKEGLNHCWLCENDEWDHTDISCPVCTGPITPTVDETGEDLKYILTIINGPTPLDFTEHTIFQNTILPPPEPFKLFGRTFETPKPKGLPWNAVKKEYGHVIRFIDKEGRPFIYVRLPKSPKRWYGLFLKAWYDLFNKIRPRLFIYVRLLKSPKTWYGLFLKAWYDLFNKTRPSGEIVARAGYSRDDEEMATYAVYSDAQALMADPKANEFAGALLAYGAISSPKVVEDIGWIWWFYGGLQHFVVSVVIVWVGLRVFFALLEVLLDVGTDLVWILTG